MEIAIRRWKGVCAYDGTHYQGWQSQKNALGIQDILESRLASIFKRPIRVHGSGRTDTGVHAHGQVFHFDAQWNYSETTLQKAMASTLPEDIQILSIESAPFTFHARYSCIGKRYIYRMYRGYASPFERQYLWSLGPICLNITNMNLAAKVLLGRHDFSAFAAKRPKSSQENPIKELRRLEVNERAPYIELITEASGYLYKMVRTLTGALVAIGNQRLTIEDLKQALETGLRPKNLVTAPAKGLFLDQVFY